MRLLLNWDTLDMRRLCLNLTTLVICFNPWHNIVTWSGWCLTLSLSVLTQTRGCSLLLHGHTRIPSCCQSCAIRYSLIYSACLGLLKVWLEHCHILEVLKLSCLVPTWTCWYSVGTLKIQIWTLDHRNWSSFSKSPIVSILFFINCSLNPFEESAL